MAPNSSVNKTKDDHVPEQALHRTKKRAFEEDTTPDTTKYSFSGEEGDAQTSRDMMLRSTSPSPSAHLTKTGRVSKAAKGMPVHHCECGKTYTRAEHLRRHQQNHKPEAFSCDVLGCDRAFSREDLLVRHKAKHNGSPESSDPSIPQTTQSTPGLNDILPSSSHPNDRAQQVAQPHASSNAHLALPLSSTGTRKDYIPIAELRPPDLMAGVCTSFFGPGGQPDWYTSFQPFYHAGSDLQTAESTSQAVQRSPLTLDTEQTWMASNMTLGAPCSPASAGSTLPSSTWRRPSPAYPQLCTPASDNSLYITHGDTGLSRNSSFADIPGTGAAILPVYRDSLEQDELVTPTSTPQHFGPHQHHHRLDNEQRYLDAYWRSVHPSWPIVHKPTFDMAYTSPLLRSAMLTLGACHTGHHIDAGNACILYKRCLKVIKNRNINSWHSYRICDMQAILMVELFSTYRSRRPPLQSSKPFQDNYCALARDYDIETTSALFTNFDALDFPQEVSTVTLERESKGRLLAAYYILDQEQATLFGRPSTDIPDFLPATLGLPQPLDIWDSNLAFEYSPYDHAGDWLYECCGTLGQAIPSRSAGTSLDIFTASLALVYTTDQTRDTSLGSQDTLPFAGTSTLSATSPHIELMRQTFSLCKSVPTRALLAVAGESWVMAEKIGLYADYKTAQETLRLWTSTSAAYAFTQALEILRLHKLYSNTTCLYHEWSLHLASLVIWACTYARRQPSKSLRLLIPLSTSSEPAVQGHELEKALATLLQAGTNGITMWQDAKCVLTWAKARIEKTGNVSFCGVASGAVDVLKALMARGDEDGWF